MLTRRHAIAGFATTAAAFAKVPMPATKPNFQVPKGACDCHTHIFGDPARFPFTANRAYTPEPALPEHMAAFHKALGVERVVIVTPSVYGTDNAVSVWGMREIGKSARGIAVIGERTTEKELDEMHKAGMRGIRLNLATAGIDDPAEGRARFLKAANRMKQRGWHIQIFTSLKVISALKQAVLDSPVPVVFDHFGGARASLGAGQPGFSDLVALVQSGKAYVKISGAYRASDKAPAYPDAAPLAKALIAANPDRVIWGTDWPHPDSSAGKERVSEPVHVDDGLLLNQLPVWAPDAATRKRILVDNPARLYGF